MSEAVSDLDLEAAWRARPWRVMRLSLVFLLDLIELTEGEGSVLDRLVLSVISTASTAPVRRDAALEHRFATLEAPPPDGLRRPIAINAVAASLNLPFESVRRAVHRLAERGEVEFTPRGPVQAMAMAQSPAHVARSAVQYERTRRLCDDLRAGGYLPAACHSATAALAAPPVRIVNRLLGDYALRTIIRVMEWTGHPMRGLVLLHVARSGAAHLPLEAFDLPGPLAPGARQPVRASEIARRTGLANETARRHIAALCDMGLLSRRDAGYVLRPEGADNKAGRLAVAAAIADLRRLLGHLERYGVLARWELERAAEQPAPLSRSGL